MSRLSIAALVLTATALAASGCGGTSGSSTSSISSSTAASSTISPKTLTRSEFIARADKICRRINAKRESFKIASKSDLASVVPVLAAYEQAAVAEMRKLTPPASIARGWNQILEGADRLANATAELGEAAKANKIQQTGTLSKEAEKANEQVLVVSKREGIMDCAQRKA